jgi:predicted kinase
MVAMPGRLIIVAGLPATGKTTLAVALERELSAVRLSADDWMSELGIDLLDATARAKIEQLQWRLARRLLELAAVVVVEWGTWSRAERDALRERARALGAAVELRFLAGNAGELWRRIESRDREQASRALTLEDVEGWAALIEPPDAVSWRSTTRRFRERARGGSATRPALSRSRTSQRRSERSLASTTRSPWRPRCIATGASPADVRGGRRMAVWKGMPGSVTRWRQVLIRASPRSGP